MRRGTMNGMRAYANTSTNPTTKELEAEIDRICSETETLIKAGIPLPQQTSPPSSSHYAGRGRMNSVQASDKASTHRTREELVAEIERMCGDIKTIIGADISGLRQATPPFNDQSARRHRVDSADPDLDDDGMYETSTPTCQQTASVDSSLSTSFSDESQPEHMSSRIDEITPVATHLNATFDIEGAEKVDELPVTVSSLSRTSSSTNSSINETTPSGTPLQSQGVHETTLRGDELASTAPSAARTSFQGPSRTSQSTSAGTYLDSKIFCEGANKTVKLPTHATPSPRTNIRADLQSQCTLSYSRATTPLATHLNGMSVGEEGSNKDEPAAPVSSASRTSTSSPTQPDKNLQRQLSGALHT